MILCHAQSAFYDSRGPLSPPPAPVNLLQPPTPARQDMFPPLERDVVVMLHAVRMACSAFNSTQQLRSGVRFFDRPVVIQVSPSLVVVAHVDEARHHPFEQHYLPQTLRRAFTFSSITTFMEESASKNRSKTGPSSTMRPPSKGFHRLH